MYVFTRKCGSPNTHRLDCEQPLFFSSVLQCLARERASSGEAATRETRPAALSEASKNWGLEKLGFHWILAHVCLSKMMSVYASAGVELFIVNKQFIAFLHKQSWAVSTDVNLLDLDRTLSMLTNQAKLKTFFFYFSVVRLWRNPRKSNWTTIILEQNSNRH